MTKVDDLKQKYNDVLENLKKERDEVKVKVHLASLEVQEEWQEIEEKWDKFKFKLGQLQKEAGKTAHEIGDALELLGKEIKEGYRRFKRLL